MAVTDAVVFRATRFVIVSIFELCLKCFRSANFVCLGMLHPVLPAKPSARPSTQSLKHTSARSMEAKCKLKRPR